MIFIIFFFHYFPLPFPFCCYSSPTLDFFSFSFLSLFFPHPRFFPCLLHSLSSPQKPNLQPLRLAASTNLLESLSLSLTLYFWFFTQALIFQNQFQYFQICGESERHKERVRRRTLEDNSRGNLRLIFFFKGIMVPRIFFLIVLCCPEKSLKLLG